MILIEFVFYVLIIALAVVALVFSFIGLIFSYSDDMGKYRGWRMLLVCLGLLLGQLYGYGSYMERDNKRNDGTTQAELAKWQAAGCPVYKSQCGSKHPYICEKKAAVIGRNQVGDTFVQAYGLCVK